MENQMYLKIKVAIAHQMLSMNLPFAEAEELIMERLVKPEMYTRAAVTNNKKWLQPSELDRAMDHTAFEVYNLMEEISYLKRCAKWAKRNEGASYISFCRVMDCKSNMPALRARCLRVDLDPSWTKLLVSHGLDTLLNPEMNGDESDFLSDPDAVDTGRMIQKKPSLDVLT